MSPLTEKLFAIVLALVLGLSPLQGAIAAAVSSAGVDTHSEFSSLQTLDDAAVTGAIDMGHDCDRCAPDGCCNGGSCASMQCSTCVAVPLASFPAAATHSTAAPESSYNHGVLTDTVASLYRPPRA